MNSAQITGYARLQDIFRRCTRDETLAAMMAYGWSISEAKYAYATWTTEAQQSAR